MKEDSLFEWGRFIKPKGLNGELHVHLEAADTLPYKNLDMLFVEEDGRKIPYMVESLSINKKDKAIVKLEDIDHKDQAAGLAGHSIYLPLEMLPEPEEGQFYYHNVIGFKVIDANLGELGAITAFYDKPGQDLLAMEYKEAEILIPVTDEVMDRPDFDKKTVHVRLPDGLLDIYISEE